MDIMKVNPAHISDFENGILIGGSEMCKVVTAELTTAPDFVGQMYINTTDNSIYIAKGTATANDWIQVEPGT